MGSAPTWGGSGCGFDSWQCQIYIPCSLSHDYLDPFGYIWLAISRPLVVHLFTRINLISCHQAIVYPWQWIRNFPLAACPGCPHQPSEMGRFQRGWGDSNETPSRIQSVHSWPVCFKIKSEIDMWIFQWNYLVPSVLAKKNGRKLQHSTYLMRSHWNCGELPHEVCHITL